MKLKHERTREQHADGVPIQLITLRLTIEMPSVESAKRIKASAGGHGRLEDPPPIVRVLEVRWCWKYHLAVEQIGHGGHWSCTHVVAYGKY